MKKLACVLLGLAALSAVLWAISPITVTVTCTPDKDEPEADA